MLSRAADKIIRHYELVWPLILQCRDERHRRGFQESEKSSYVGEEVKIAVGISVVFHKITG